MAKTDLTSTGDLFSVRPPPVVGAELKRCIFCEGTNIRREGKRYKKLETVQLWYCRTCDRTFTPQRAKGKKYPLKLVLESLQLYYHGQSREFVSERMAQRFGVKVPLRTLSNWLAEYRAFTPYARLRQSCLATYRPNRLIHSVRLHHQQVYEYRLHRGKLSTILAMPEHEAIRPLEGYLQLMAEACPHRLFQTDMRASQGRAPFDLDAVEIQSKHNHACRVANLVLQCVTHNRRRHDELQRFMLATDSVTVAVEVPVHISPEELSELKAKSGFQIPIESDATLTGHIDVLQVRNRKLHILDYKPDAKHEKPIAQLMVYALALSRRTGIRLFDMVCAWFDERNYFEFYPLRVVSKRR